MKESDNPSPENVRALEARYNALLNDIEAIKVMAAKENWPLGINYSNILLEKKQAIAIRDGLGEPLFFSSNLSLFAMQPVITYERLIEATGERRLVVIYDVKEQK